MIIHSKLAHASIFNVYKQLLNVIYKSQRMLYDCHAIILLAIIQKKNLSYPILILCGMSYAPEFNTLGWVRVCSNPLTLSMS